MHGTLEFCSQLRSNVYIGVLTFISHSSLRTPSRPRTDVPIHGRGRIRSKLGIADRAQLRRHTGIGYLQLYE